MSADTNAKMNSLMEMLPRNRLLFAVNLLTREASAVWWFETPGEYGSLKRYFAHRLDLGPRFAFELLFEQVE